MKQDPGKRALAWRILVVLSVGATPGCAVGCHKSPGGSGDAGQQQAREIVQEATRPTMAAFGSEEELRTFLTELAEAQKRDLERARGAKAPGGPPPPQAAPAAEAAGGQDEESVTNVQHAGVDEGGIVKVHGEHLVVLRRGRLFTVRIGDDELSPVSAVDAFGPDVDPAGSWYDEMLVADDTIVVVGYSYQRGGTELGLFDLDAAGHIRYRATYHLRSNDYYSSRNYASRLIGRRLVFYSPLYLRPDPKDIYASFPAMRRWHAGATPGEFRRIAEATRIYRPLIPSPHLALHTVTSCDLAGRELTCQATAVMGPPGRVFYVSPASVYVWMTHWERGGERSVGRSLVYRMPLDGSGPTALRVAGSPVDQLSFLESDDGHLNVLVRADARGEGMWGAEVTEGAMALMRVPLTSFSAEPGQVPATRYRALPKPEGPVLQNRFVGHHVLYGTGSGWGDPDKRRRGEIVVYRFAGGAEPVSLPLVHGVDRIEALGAHAVVVGTDGRDLHFSPIALGERPAVADRYTRPGASQGELRSHGFFYKPETESAGLLGLPIRGEGRPGYEHLVEGSASILFLRNDSLRLSEIGSLGARAEGRPEDGCRASCVDWYGNARPLFLRGRLFALLGYELVEGTLSAGGIEERRRIDFSPVGTRIVR